MLTSDQLMRAACRGMADPDIMSTTWSGAMVHQARRICANCPFDVRRACVTEAYEMSFGDPHTIRGGLTPEQRRKFTLETALDWTDHPARFLGSGGGRGFIYAKVTPEPLAEFEAAPC